jgi:hypothetical protein
VEKGENMFEHVLKTLTDRENKINALTDKYNTLEKAFELERLKVKCLAAKVENNHYLDLNVSDEKFM